MLPTRQSPLAQDHCDAPLVGAILGGPQVDGAMVPSALESLIEPKKKTNDPIAPYTSYLLCNITCTAVPAGIQVSETTQHK